MWCGFVRRKTEISKIKTQAGAQASGQVNKQMFALLAHARCRVRTCLVFRLRHPIRSTDVMACLPKVRTLAHLTGAPSTHVRN